MGNDAAKESDPVGRIFEEALGRSGQERTAFLNEACDEDPALRKEVENLLAAHDGSVVPGQELASGDGDAQDRGLEVRFAGSEYDGDTARHDALAQEPFGELEGSALQSSTGRDDPEYVSEVLERLSRPRRPFTRYELKGEIARGGMGAILRVWDKDLRRDLAMKVNLGQRHAFETGSPRSVDGQTLRRFLEEAHITSRLDHPGIVPVHELGLDAEGRVYFTMKLVRGQDLKSVFALLRAGEEGWSQTRALNVMLKVCDAMAYAHSKGVVHRDLKPANVMVGRYGEVYVMDWGLARALGTDVAEDLRDRPRTQTSEESLQAWRKFGDDSPMVTLDGDVLGTPTYMSPEQACGDHAAVGSRSDVYAAGAMLYELLAGQAPYVVRGKRLSHHTILFLIASGPPAPLHGVAPDAPAELAAICEKAMKRSSSRRYADMSELAEDLRASLEHRVVNAYETGAVAELRKWVQRNKGLAVSLAAALLVAIGGLGAVSYVLAQKAEQERRLNQIMALASILECSAGLKGLEQQADDLWPAHPEKEELYERWLAEADALIDSVEAERAELALELEGGGRRGADEASGALSDRLRALTETIQAFKDEESGLIDGSFSGEYGWGIKRRLESAQTIEEESTTGPGVGRRWEQAIEAISGDPTYAGLDLVPQLGLVPVRADPDSGLWEFWHVQTGKEPRRDDEGQLELTEEMGLVFVLLPGGTFWMGAQNEDRAGPNFDPKADSSEGPVHQVTLSPFFMSKFEMTQGQWKHFSGANPSRHGPEDYRADRKARGLPPVPFTLLYPVENLSWDDCTHMANRLGLSLPTEAQWEYATRAGTGSIWWPGDAPSSLEGVANLADAYAKQFGMRSAEPWDDGFYFQAPVGTFRPNAFGLHDVYGNVYEWCFDGYLEDAYASAVSRVDPCIEPGGVRNRVGRGGDYQSSATGARSAIRGDDLPDYRSPRMGVRLARRIDR